MTCRHRNKRRQRAKLARLEHPDPTMEWVVEVCEDCGAERVAEVEYDERGKVRGMEVGYVSALPWRKAPAEAKLRLVK